MKGPGIVSGHDIIVGMAGFLLESTELDEPIAHDIRIRGQTLLYPLDYVGRDAVVIFLLKVDYL